MCHQTDHRNLALLSRFNSNHDISNWARHLSLFREHLIRVYNNEGTQQCIISNSAYLVGKILGPNSIRPHYKSRAYKTEYYITVVLGQKKNEGQTC